MVLGNKLVVRNSFVAYSATPPASRTDVQRYLAPSSSRQPPVIVAVSVTPLPYGLSQGPAVEIHCWQTHFSPAASIPRSSFFRSAISSRNRAASSNCRSRAAAIICSVRSLIRSASSARGMLVVSRPSNTPALTARPGSPWARAAGARGAGGGVAAGPADLHGFAVVGLAIDLVEDVGDLLAQRLRVDAVCLVVGDLLRPPALGLVDRLFHRIGDRVRIHVHFTGDVAGGAADGLDQAAR